MDCAIWNILHDGAIVAAAGAVPGDVTLRVAIDYLCAELPTDASEVVVTLRGCTRFAFQPWTGAAADTLESIVALHLELLSAELVDGRAIIICVGGQIEAIYDRVEASLADGTPISIDALDAAAHRYWDAWEARHRQARGGK